MLISEIFYSLQGEGELTGVPSVFIRTSGCNLRCQWCDTPYASWRPEGVQMSEPDILAKVRAYPADHIVLTGGEPMLAAGIHELAAALRAEGKHLTIETAATVLPNSIACDLASLSPKLANSTPLPEPAGMAWVTRHEQTRRQPDVLRRWISAYPFQLKFVVREPADLKEIRQLLHELALQIPPHKVLLMPEGRELTELRQRNSWLTEACKAEGYRYCHRLHVELFGNQRGT